MLCTKLFYCPTECFGNISSWVYFGHVIIGRACLAYEHCSAILRKDIVMKDNFFRYQCHQYYTRLAAAWGEHQILTTSFSGVTIIVTAPALDPWLVVKQWVQVTNK